MPDISDVIINQLNKLDNKVDKMQLDVAVLKNDVSIIKKVLDGNGGPGLCKRVAYLESTGETSDLKAISTKWDTIKKITDVGWKTIFILGVLLIGGKEAMQMFLGAG